MPLPAAVGFAINTISNSFIGVPLVLTRISVGAWALKSADELAPGVIYLPKEDPARLAAERELIDRFMREVLPLSTQPSDFEESINSRSRKTKSASTIPSPIVLDLDGDGVETTSVGNGAWFDHATDGFAERTRWAGSDDGLLVRDLDDNGTIDSGRELFGSESLQPSGIKAANGFEALKALDANADGVINAQDAAFAELRVWKDANANGRTDAGELLTLAEADVASVNLAYTNSSHIDTEGNAHRQVGSYTTASGETRTATDIWVQTNTTQSLPTDWVDVPEDIAALPDAQGYGLVRDLQQAMAMDASGELKTLVEAFTQATTPQERDLLVTQLVYHWTGVQDIDPASRASRMIYGNAIGDARKLEALEEFMGQEWVGVWCWGTRDPNPHGRAAPVLLQAWDELKALVYGQLMVQTQLNVPCQQVTCRWGVEVKGHKSQRKQCPSTTRLTVKEQHTNSQNKRTELTMKLNQVRCRTISQQISGQPNAAEATQ